MNPIEDEESLYNFLIAHKNEVEYINLTWTWNEMKVVESDRCLVIEEKGQKFAYETYLGFSVDILDEEYSFTGSYEDALQFASSYDCWDGFEFKIDDGVLELEHQGDNFEFHYHPDELEPYNRDILSIVYLGLYTWYNSKDGNNIAPVYSWQRDKLMLWSEWNKDKQERKEDD